MKKLFLIFVLLWLPGLAEAATYWVRPGGTAGGACPASDTAPVADSGYKSTIDAGLSCMKAGDTLNIRAGTYSGSIRQAGWPSGSGTTYTTVQGYAGEAVTITPVGWNFAFYNADSHHIILRGVKIDSLSGTGGGTAVTNGSHHITMENVEITGMNGQGVQVGSAHGSIFRNVTFHDAVSDCVPGNRWYGIYIGATNDAVIENSTFYNLPGGGIQAYNSGGTANTNLTIRNNRFYNVPTCNTSNIGGFVIADTSSGQAYNNVIYSTLIGAGGQYASAMRLYDGAANFSLYGNTVYNTHSGHGIEIHGSVGGTVNVRNNILSTSSPFSDTHTGGAVVNSSNNLCLTACGFGSSNQAEAAANTFTAPGSVFTLKPGSLAIDNGTNVGLSFSPDIAGVARPAVGPWEIGAYESGVITPAVSQLALALPLDEGTGSIAVDVSGQKNNATLVGGATWDNDGKYGKAIMLDGTGYLHIPTSSSLAVQGMTLEAWIYPTSSPGATFFSVIFKDTYYLYASSEAGYCPAPALAPLGGYSTATTARYLCATSLPPVNQWSHLAVTYNGSQTIFYLDGNIIATQTSTDLMVPSSYDLQVGASVYGEHFRGKIDQPMIYSYARTPAQIVSDMNTPLIGAPGKYVEIAPATSVEISAASSLEISAD